MTAIVTITRTVVKLTTVHNGRKTRLYTQPLDELTVDPVLYLTLQLLRDCGYDIKVRNLL